MRLLLHAQGRRIAPVESLTYFEPRIDVFSFRPLLHGSHYTAASCRVGHFSLKTVTTERQPSAFLTLRPSTSVRAPPPNWVEDNTLPWQLLCAGPGARNCFFAHTSPSRSVHYSVPPRALARYASSFAVLFPLLLCSFARFPTM